MGSKICRTCALLLPVSSFRFRKDTQKHTTECKKCRSERSVRWVSKNREQNKSTGKIWYQKNRSKRRVQERTRTKLLKDAVFNHYGNACGCCGERERLFLAIDHKNNDGAAERRVGIVYATLYRKIIKENFPDRYQVLCANCNWGKHRNGGICPHKNP